MAENLSSVPPIVTLSGLPGVGSFSGASQQGPSGTTPAQGQATPGLMGGLDLAQLLALLGQQSGAGDAGIGTGLGLGAGIGAGSFGQRGADLLGGGRTPGQSQIAGNTQGGAPGTGTGSIDPLALTQKLLGLASKGAGLLGTASPTQDALGGTGGTSLSDQARSGQGGAFTAPTVAPTASPVSAPGDINAPGIPPDLLQDPSLGGVGAAPGTGIGDTGTNPQATSLSFLNQTGAGGVAQGTQQQELIQSLLAQGVPPDQIVNAVNAFNAQGFGAGELTGGPNSGLASPTQGLSGASLGGQLSGGAQGLQSLLGIIQALGGKGTDASKGIGVGEGLAGLYGGLNTAFPGTFPSLTQAAVQGLIQAAPETAASLGLNAASDIGGVIGGAGFGPGLVTIGSNPAGAVPLDQNSQIVAQILQSIPVVGVPLAMLFDAIAGPFEKPGNQMINRVTGTQGPQTTQALEDAQKLTQGVDLSNVSNQGLESLIPLEGQALERYYNQNLPESRYLTGLQAEGSPEFGQVNKALQADQAALLQSIGLLQQRGVSPTDIGNIMTPQLNNISQIYNQGFAGLPGYTSPAALMQQQGFGSNQELAAAYGGPTWLALQNIFGPNLGGALGNYGGTAPGLTLPQAPQQDALAAANAASQYNPNLPATPEQIASQYGAIPGWLGSPE